MENKESVELIKTFYGVRIEIGVFEPEASLYEKVKILNTDDTITEMEMKVSDIMFLTEYGTMTLPARPILKRLKNKVQPELQQLLKGFFMANYTEEVMENILHNYINQIETVYIPNMIEEMKASNSNISNILNEKDTSKYLFDLSKLKKYIKCKIFFEK